MPPLRSTPSRLIDEFTPIQPKTGYRFTIDPFILCAGISLPKTGHIVDIGTGCGIIPLLLSRRNPALHITGVEVQEELCLCARQNISDHGLQHRIQILHRDINTLNPTDLRRPADIIVSNPPYKKKGTGRLNPNPAKAIARHELLLSINQLYLCAANLLAPDGQIMVIFPAARQSDLESAVKQAKLNLTWIRFIQLSRTKKAFRILAAASKDSQRSCRVFSPIILYREDNTPTKEHKAFFNP